MAPCVSYLSIPICAALAAGQDTPESGWLSTIDSVLAAVAGILIGWLTLRWLLGGRRDLLAAPRHPNAIRENAVAIAAMAYLLGALAATMVVPYLTADDGLAAMIVGMFAQVVGGIACLYTGSDGSDGGLSAFVLGGGNARPALVTTATFTLIALGVCPWVLQVSLDVVARCWPDFEPPAHATIELLEKGDGSAMLVVALWLGATLVAPIAEELFFRGLLQTTLINLTGRRWFGVTVASIFFGFVHFSQPQAVVPLVILSFMLGYVYERTGSLLWPILIHALFNLKTLIWFTLGAYAAG